MIDNPTKMLKLSIIVPTFNRKAAILNLLDILSRQEAPGCEISVYVVVDGSTDGTQEAIREQYPDTIVVEGDGNWWWTRSVNEGCKAAVDNGADYLLLLNDDVGLCPRYLHFLMESANSKPGAIIGSLNITMEEEKKIFFSGASHIRNWDGKPQRYHPFLAPYRSKEVSGLQKTVVLPGRGMLIPVSVLIKNNFFDQEKLPHYKADYDFTLRAVKKKIPVFVSWDAIVYTILDKTGGGATFKKQSLLSFFKSFFHPRSRTNLYQNFIYYKRHLPGASILLLPISAPCIMCRQMIQFVTHKKY